ncbi:MAG: hypothetical protein JWO36_5528 [Myxococcales bacterium]|nr:hypothetical protein [Myxococcales bacterium]
MVRAYRVHPPGVMTIKQAKKLTHNVVDGAGDLAKRVGCAAQDVAESIGPKRGLIGLAVIGVAVGGSILARRYFRNRGEVGVDSEFDQTFEGSAKKGGKSKMRANSAHVHAH